MYARELTWRVPIPALSTAAVEVRSVPLVGVYSTVTVLVDGGDPALSASERASAEDVAAAIRALVLYVTTGSSGSSRRTKETMSWPCAVSDARVAALDAVVRECGGERLGDEA